MKHLKLFEEYSGDMYDEMDKKFPLTDKFMKDTVQKLVSMGITPTEVEEPDYDVDGTIGLSDATHIQVGLDNDYTGVVEIPSGSFVFTNTTTDLDKVLADIEVLKKKYNVK